MKKPVDVEHLIEELSTHKVPSTVIAHEGAKMVVIVEDDGEKRYEFEQHECELVLNSVDNVEKLVEALNYPTEAYVELHSLEIEEDVRNTLESKFSTVDEM